MKGRAAVSNRLVARDVMVIDPYATGVHPELFMNIHGYSYLGRYMPGFGAYNCGVTDRTPS